MSSYKRVVDYMASAPDSANHIQLWQTAQMDRLRETVDGLDLEQKCIGPAERDLIAALESQPKFTLGGMVDGIDLGVSVDARTSSGDKVVREQNVRINFRGAKEWTLAPSVAQVDYVTRDPAFYTLDLKLRDNIIRQCPELSAAQYSELRVDAVKDALSMPVDMRHMFMKMMLMLWDYTLAATSRVSSMEMAADLVDVRRGNVPADARLAIMASNRVVIDAEGMSPRELGLLYLAAQEYPPVWYCGENMYNKCTMAADDVILLASGKIDIDISGIWGSPDTMYQLIWGIASKLESVKCLAEAMSALRGKCRHMADMTEVVGSVTVYSGVPLSICKTRGMGQRGAPTLISREAGYMSTSMSLLTDNLLGTMFELAATFTVENVGGLGSRVCGALVATDRCYNGLLRDIGLRHDDASVNVVLRNFCSLTGSPRTWGYGGLIKDYIIGLTTNMKQGWDVVIPQLTTLIPYLDAGDSCWGASRGYSGKPDVFKNDDVTSRAEQLSVCSWLLGQRRSRPYIRHNHSGKMSRASTADERALAVDAGTSFRIGAAKLWVVSDVGGREDEYSEGGGVLVKATFANVKCQLLYDTSSQTWRLPTPEFDYPTMVKQTTYGIRPTIEVEPVVVGPAPNLTDETFSGVRAMLLDRPIKPSIAPRPEYNHGGVPKVPLYKVSGGNESDDMVRVCRAPPPLGKTSYTAIEVPGDGKCGLHAVVTDLKVHGLLGEHDGNRLFAKLEEATLAPTFHSPDEIAGAALQMGLGLDVIADGIVHSYGNNPGHRILLRCENSHYQPLIPDPNGVELDVTSIQHQANSDSDFIKRLGEFERMMGRA